MKPWILALLAPLLLFALTESILTAFGVKPLALTEDPYMGYSSLQPLFVLQTTASGKSVYVTNPTKLPHFNPQSFPVEKAVNTFRIFCVGGSTTYGHPYRDATSYCGWLRALLNKTDKTKNYEVINAGGISYASYREAELIAELSQYQPDLFLVYSGHNEFLEERTYRSLMKIPPALRATSALLDRTRSYSILRRAVRKGLVAFEKSGPKPDSLHVSKSVMSQEVDDVLAKTIGPTSYTRNDTLKSQVVKHFAFSLRRMAQLAHGAGARVLFITVPVNERNCTPFKSENTPNLSAIELEQSQSEWQNAEKALDEKRDSLGYAYLKKAALINWRHAHLQYALGQSALVLKKYDEAKIHFRLAIEEDICPLRALSAMDSVIRLVAKESDSWLLDYTHSLENKTLHKKGHTLLGEPDFVDHVHLDITNYRELAIEILVILKQHNLASPQAQLTSTDSIALVDSVMATVNTQEQGFALHNLAKVLNWAGKHEDADRLAMRALQKDSTSLEAIWSSLFVGAALERQGLSQAATLHYLRATRLDSMNAQSHYLLGMAYLRLSQDSSAEKELQKAATLTPNDKEIRNAIDLLTQNKAWHQTKLRALNSPMPEAIGLLLPFAQTGEHAAEAQALLENILSKAPVAKRPNK